jgi:hypothetical protein
MKHVLGLVLLLLLCSGVSAVNFRIAGGLDVAGETATYMNALAIGAADNMGLTFSAQALNNVKDFSYGVGVDYQSTRDNKKLPGGWSSNLDEHSFVPVYGIFTYNIPTISKFSHELITQLGYNFSNIEFPNSDQESRYSADDGLFYGLGVGVSYEQLSLQVLYRVNSFKFVSKEYYGNTLHSTEKYDANIRQFNISLGYRFGKN